MTTTALAMQPPPPVPPSGKLQPSFNLWHQPWIRVTSVRDGSTTEVSIADCLNRAHEFSALYSDSPLVVAGIHRLLAAVAQAIHDPREVTDLAVLLTVGRFTPEGIARFGDRYAHRFDLFSPAMPFLQTGDASLHPAKGDKPKTVAYLLPEAPAGTAVTHFRHLYDKEYHLCPPCAAGGLVTLPAFATSGGRGMKPSINGVPPLYVLPAGPTLFETLALSLIVPSFQPQVAAANDTPIWATDGRIMRGTEVESVGYLQSLTFPARRVRLHPDHTVSQCSRCGRAGDTFISTMVFEMGQNRPKGAPSWFDPFAAYTLRGNDPPSPIRLVEGKAPWREYGALFLARAVDPKGEKSTVRPAVMKQIDALVDRGAIDSARQLTFRCIGIRTDMKAKIFEWADASLEVPVGLLSGQRGAFIVDIAIDHAETWRKDLRQVFRTRIGGKRERHLALLTGMEATYWIRLTAPFRQFVLSAAEPDRLEEAERVWVDTVLQTGRKTFKEAVDAVGDRGADLRQRTQALQVCDARLAKRRKEWLS